MSTWASPLPQIRKCQVVDLKFGECVARGPRSRGCHDPRTKTRPEMGWQTARSCNHLNEHYPTNDAFVAFFRQQIRWAFLANDKNKPQTRLPRN